MHRILWIVALVTTVCVTGAATAAPAKSGAKRSAHATCTVASMADCAKLRASGCTGSCPLCPGKASAAVAKASLAPKPASCAMNPADCPSSCPRTGSATAAVAAAATK